MGKVIATMSMSLDGLIADPAGGIDQLFDWMGTGAGHLRHAMSGVGALVAGRRLYDITGGWGGSHPLGVPVIVVTHTAPAAGTGTITFAGTVHTAVDKARAAAGDKDIVVAGAKTAQQCLDAGLLDAVHIDLVPILLGQGIRWFENLRRAPVRFHTPTITEGDGVTHLAYAIATPH